MLVRELRIRDRELAAQLQGIRRADRVEPLVGFRVDARDEEARHGVRARRIAARGDEPLETAQVGLDDLLVALQREDQRHVDVLAGGDHVFDRGDARLRRGNLHVEVRPVDPLVQSLRLLVSVRDVVRERRVDLPGDVAVEAVRPLPHGAHQLARILDVAGGEPVEDLLRLRLLGEHLLQLLVVGGAL